MESPTPNLEKRPVERKSTLNSQYEPPSIPDIQYMAVVDDQFDND